MKKNQIFSTDGASNRLLKVGTSNASNDAMYYKRFVDLVPEVKISGLKKFIFFVDTRERWGYLSN